MKKLVYPLVLLLLMTIAIAGEIRKIDIEEELGNKDTLFIDIKTGEGLEFDMFEGRHVISVDKMHEKGVDFDIFLFVNKDEDQKVSYMTVSPKRTIKLDFDKDGVGDIYIGFKEFLSENRATIIFYNPLAEIAGDGRRLEGITGETIAKTPGNSKYIHLFFGTTIVILLLLTTYFLLKQELLKNKLK